MICLISAIKNSWRWGLVVSPLLTGWWVDKLTTFKHLFVGFSGGLDSTVLLHCLIHQPDLRDKLCAVHVHHGLSANADSWQACCQRFCRDYDIPLITRSVQIPVRSNIEEKARNARYQVFQALLGVEDGLILAHHAQDQAETLLLQLFRGAGIDGMAAMPDCIPLQKGSLIRPLLQYTRLDLEHYAHDHGLNWVDDESNRDYSFTRNYLRHEIMPLLQEKWPGLITNVVRSTHHCQKAQDNLIDLAELDCPELVNCDRILAISSLLCLKRARIENVLRVWLKKNNVRMPSTKMLNCLVEEVLLAKGDAQPSIEWDKIAVKRFRDALYLIETDVKSHTNTLEWRNFPESLAINNKIKLNAMPANEGVHVPDKACVEVRFRQGGESIRVHGKRKTLKKLMQQWHIPPWEREKIPLLYINDQLASVVGYAINDLFYIKEEAFQIELQKT